MICVGCDRPLRPAGTRAADHPGTLAHIGRSMCPACYKRARAAERNQPTPPARRLRLAALDHLPPTPAGQALAAWRDERRARGVPVNGLPRDQWRTA
ncbi:hypothetical protein M3686_04725 [Micrococcus luteus]|uniref:hypothetical protein n=1 Tax=Micrococcus luteus TaxID=1270 RepID=UPI00203EE830|nr:hypothetical protein [Micrococcus luteus]MCM3577438.1 hypothetical protein [Micrococcus luteus]